MRAWPSRYGPTLPITSTPSSVITTGLLLCSTTSSTVTLVTVGLALKSTLQVYLPASVLSSRSILS